MFCQSKNKKNIKNYLLKIFVFYNLKNLCSLHGHVFVMLRFLEQDLSAIDSQRGDKKMCTNLCCIVSLAQYTCSSDRVLIWTTYGELLCYPYVRIRCCILVCKSNKACSKNTFEPPHGKTNNDLHRRKQRRRSASQ